MTSTSWTVKKQAPTLPNKHVSGMRIPFNKPYSTGKELAYISEAMAAGHLSGDGRFSSKCQDWLGQTLGCAKPLLVPSCTAALEMAAILCELDPGGEVIMPAFTFSSTANAVVLRRAIPVFVDVRSDTLNLDETLIEAAITPRTKAIFIVHYAGVACEMDRIRELAERYRLALVEDAAHALLGRYKGQYLGTIGDIGALSFHETKNVISGEGGAILVNGERYRERADVVREKGTDRAKFFRGEVDKYTWIEVGSSYLQSEIAAAYLFAQLEQAHELTRRRKQMWARYHESFADLEAAERLRRPIVPSNCDHNGNLYYLLLPGQERRAQLIDALKDRGISAPFHYVPLHTSPAGRRFGRAHGRLPVTVHAGECLVRLPLFVGLEPQLDEIIDAVRSILRR
jgi:dTDP-4-amino-4,6-dideoxygalactose transaminase